MNEIIEKEEFNKIVSIIKNEIKNTQVKTMLYANKNLIMMYFKIGKILDDKSKYGNRFIKNISHSIRLEYPNIKGFLERNLMRMKRFYNEYKNEKKLPQAVAQLPWGHNIILIEKIKDIKTRKIYIEATIKEGWSRSILELQIENNYHKRIGNSVNNFKKIPLKIDSDLVNNIIKDPYIV